ncbi:DUF2057 domain-containing protein [Vibrio sp.]|nr:DUF2057 domain-containing protein [Vibrio sp.]
MNNKITSVLAVTMMASFSSIAAVKVDFHPEVEAVIINGKDYSQSLNTPGEVELPDGANQLMLRVTRLIREQGRYNKFKSEPVVLTINATDTSFKIEPGKEFTSIEQVGDFKKKPTLKIMTESGNEPQYNVGYLERGDSLIRNYSAELAAFNAQHNYQFSMVAASSAAVVATEQAAASKGSTNTISLNEGTDLDKMKKAYSELPLHQQKAFLSWAVTQ